MVRTYVVSIFVLTLPWLDSAATPERANLTLAVSSPYPPIFKIAKYAVGAQPSSVAVGDFNGDSKPDIVTANQAAATVSVLINNGDGTFKSHVDYATGAAPSQVIVGEFNGDAKADLAITNAGEASISILLGNGDGTFQPRKDTFLSPWQGAFSVAAADVDGDGKLDLVVVPADITLLGKGDGTFLAPIGFELANGGALAFVLLANMNGQTMVGTMNDYPPFKIEQFIPKGTGQWTNIWEVLPGGANPRLGQLAAADVNGDGSDDVAAALFGENQVILCTANGDGLLGCGNNVNVGVAPVGVALADLTGDGLPDVLTANSGARSISFLRGHGDRTLGPRTNYAVGKGPRSVAVADFDGNGREDVAVANTSDGTVTTLLQSTAALSASSLSFGKHAVGTTSSPKVVTLFNAGTSPLNISGVSVSGDFFLQSNSCGASVASGASCKLSVLFAPSAAGMRTGKLQITDDALASPQMVALSGKGI